MKLDPYAKVVLTVIALALVTIACNQYINPKTSASAQGPFAGLQAGSANEAFFFDTRTGELWVYYVGLNEGSTGHFRRKFRLTRLGQPLTVESGKAE